MRACLSALVTLLALAGCSPTFNWRDVRPNGAGVQLMLPCKPDAHARQVRLGEDEVRLELHACRAGEITWALAWVDVGRPERVAPALAELRRSAATNLGVEDQGRELTWSVPGATPGPGSARVALQGRLPDGSAIRGELALFAGGTRVYQATCLGTTLPPEQVETFFGSLRVVD